MIKLKTLLIEREVDYKKAAKLILQHKPTYMYVDGPWLFHTGGNGLSLGSITQKYKGFGDSMTIKNLIWYVTHAPEEEASREIEKYTKGTYTVKDGVIRPNK